MERGTSETGIYEGKLTKMHPALDFQDGTAWVLVPLSMHTLDGIESKPWIINSKKEKFVYDQNELKKKGFQLIEGCLISESRWSYVDSIKPWLEGKAHADIRAIYGLIKERYERFLHYSDKRLYTFFPLWNIGTYFFPLFNAYPIVFLVGVSESGKSKTMEISRGIAFNAILTPNISDAGLFRYIQATRGTLLLDEKEDLGISKYDSNTMSLLLGSFKKGNDVIRIKNAKEGDFSLARFELYSPKMFANIKGLKEEALKNRCISIVLTPARHSNQAKIEVPIDSKRFREIRNLLYVYLMDHWQDVLASKKAVKKQDIGLYGYSLQLWLPILTIARLVGKNEFEEMKELALEKVELGKEDRFAESNLHRLFITIKHLIKDRTEAVEVCGKEMFYSFDSIYRKFIGELGYADMQSVPRYYSKQSVGRMLVSLDIGRYGQIAIEGKIIRGRWLSEDYVNNTQARFGFPVHT